MITLFQLAFSLHFWKNHFSKVTLFKIISSVIGTFVGALEIAKKIWSFHDKEDKTIDLFISSNYWNIVIALLAIGTVLTLIILFPKRKIVVPIKKRDMKVSIEIGDVFATKETLVIGTNRTFDTDTTKNLISPKSLQAIFANKFFKDIPSLDNEIESELDTIPYDQLTAQEKRRGKLKQYPIGTTVKLHLAKTDRDAYLVAIATMNGHGVASSSIDNFRFALASFWLFVQEKGGGSPQLRMPVMGTGLAKLPATRQEIVREILRSFFAAIAAEHFCSQLTIVISPNDFIEHEINLQELGEYLNYLATYTEFRTPSETGGGISFSPASIDGGTF